MPALPAAPTPPAFSHPLSFLAALAPTTPPPTTLVQDVEGAAWGLWGAVKGAQTLTAYPVPLADITAALCDPFWYLLSCLSDAPFNPCIAPEATAGPVLFQIC